ncbi:MAG: hypothetical protein RI964_3005 [Pseudomonadota bacterium]|jgi:hypothetical protein
MLANSGFQIMGSPVSNDKPSSIVVVGLNRGGTSAIAASLHAMGVALGKAYNEPIYEDIQLARAVRAKDWLLVKLILKQYEQDYAKFAWKLPDNYKYLERIHKYLSNPYYIFIYRDIFARSLRHSLVYESDIVNAMRSGLEGYEKIVKFFNGKKLNALHVSYEKMLNNREEFAQALLDFCGVEHQPEIMQRIIDVTSPYPASYTNWAMGHKQKKILNEHAFDGWIDGFEQHNLSGWMVKMGSPQLEPLRIHVFINDVLWGTFLADYYRQDILDIGLSSNGKAGFLINCESAALKARDTITVRPEHSPVGLSVVYQGKPN